MYEELYHRSAGPASSSGRSACCDFFCSGMLPPKRRTARHHWHLELKCRREQIKRKNLALCRRGCPGKGLPALAAKVSALQILSSLWTQPSLAGETLPVDFIANFLERVENLGPFGPLFFVGTVVSAEMLPLFPTQPLTIASGLLFGPLKGAACALLATSTAAVLAFQLSRRVGRSIAESAAGKEVEETKSSGLLNKVEQAIESGSFQQQVVAVTLLRMTPVVPFSASNYLLGATPLKFSAYMLGSLIGLSFWCTLFAAVGSAGREVFLSGASLDVLLDDLLGRAGSLTETAGVGMALFGLVALGYYAYQRIGESTANQEDVRSEEHKQKCKQS